MHFHEYITRLRHTGKYHFEPQAKQKRKKACP